MDFGAKYGPWAVIAGASEGLGVSFAEQLAAAGINIILIARNAEKLDDVAAMLVDRFAVQVRKAVIDLTSDDMVEPQNRRVEINLRPLPGQQ